MLCVAFNDLKPGMKVAKDVQLDDGRLLLLSGFIINQRYLSRLEAFNIPYVYIQEEEVKSEAKKEDEVYNEASDTIKSVMTSLREGKEINSEALKETVNDIISHVITNETVFSKLEGIRDIDNYTYLHSIDVCIYSLMAGKFLGLKGDELLELGTSAALHDIGKSKVPMEVLMKPGKLTPEEFAQMKLHPVYSKEIISNMKGFGKRIADVSSQHHEKWDGSGYPNGIKGKDIDYFARIISVADVYDAITADRVYKKREMPHKAADFILKNRQTQFDADVAEIFINNMTFYHQGTIVLLSSDEVGCVVETVKGLMTRPKINIFASKGGPPLINPYVMDLSEEENIEVIDILS